MAEGWLLFETLSGPDDPPTLLAIGRRGSSKRLRMQRPDRVMATNRYRDEIVAVVLRAARGNAQVSALSHDGQRQLLGVPLADSAGHVNGVWAWTGDPGGQPPARERAGAYFFNLTTGTAGAGEELFDLYAVGAEERRRPKLTAEALTRMLPNQAEAEALALMVRAKPGDDYQAVWLVRCDDGEVRAVDVACRTVAHVTESGATQVVIRGIVRDLGPRRDDAGSGHVLLEREVLRASREPGRTRAVVNPDNLDVLRWLDPPLDGLAWKGCGPRPGPHPEDQDEIRRMRADLAELGQARGTLRLRSVSGGWIGVRVTARPVQLDEEKHTTAALVTLSAVS